jgi:hypothetical protein
MVKKIPGWAEMTYANTLTATFFTERDHILSWLFHSLQGHHGIAYSIMNDARKRFNDTFLKTLEDHSLSRIKSDLYSIRGAVRILTRMLNKYFG